MNTRGHLQPGTAAAAQAAYEALELPAETVTKAVAEAGTDSAEAYRSFLDGEVFETAQKSLFAASLVVHVGTVEEYETWLSHNDAMTASMAGHAEVEGRAWHPVLPREAVAAVSFADSPDAAVATVRRGAFGEFYRPMIEP
ncbi:MAG: DUF5809 family protein [Halodesulfurarchaeum sp.]